MRNVAFELALIGAILCSGFGWNAKSDVKNSQEFRLVRQAERELSKPGADERQVLWGLGTIPGRYQEAKTAYRWVHWLCYALLAGFPLGVLGTLLVRHGKGWLAGPVLLLAAAGPLVCVVRLASYNRDILLFGLPGVALALAGLLSFFVRARPAAGHQEKPPTPAPVAASPPATAPALLSVACPTCATSLKYPPLSRPRSIRCPRCKTVVPVPAASPVEEAQLVEPEPEDSTPEPKQQPGPRSASPGGTVLGWVLLIGGAAAFSVLTALDIIVPGPTEPEVDLPLGPPQRPGGRVPGERPREEPPGPGRQKDEVPGNPLPDPGPGARLSDPFFCPGDRPGTTGAV